MQNVLIEDDKIIVGKQIYLGGELDIEDVLEDYKLYNKKTYIYPNGYTKEVFASKWTFKVRIPHKPQKLLPPQNSYYEFLKSLWRVPSEPKGEWERRKEADKRACRKIEDIILLNEDMRYFATLTFDLSKVNSSNTQEVATTFTQWLKNNAYRKGLKYVFVPEYHQKDNKIHFHGVINDALTFVDSGTRKVAGVHKPVRMTKIQKWLRQGRITEEAIGDIVYNIDEWRFGFSTATKLPKNKKNIVLYVTKYIEKDVMGKNKIFGKRYWSSRSCETLPPIRLENVPVDVFESLKLKEYSNPYDSISYKYRNNMTERKE